MGIHRHLRRGALLARRALQPRFTQHLDTDTWVARVVPDKVTARLEADDGVVAEEEELFPVTHG